MLENPVPLLDQLTEILKQQQSITVNIHVTPKSQQNRLMKYHLDEQGRINIRAKIRGVPENGEVNHNLIIFLAKELHLPTSQCQITGGFKSRHKTVLITKP